MKKLRIAENISYYLGLIVSAIGLILSYLARRNLPEGACPMDNYRSILIGGIVLLGLSILLGFINSRQMKK